MQTQAERELLNELIVKADERALGQRMLTALDFGGTALFAVVGTQLAGEAGMHVIGATWVGCVAGMGGGTLNELLFGGGKGGVFWMRDPRFFATAVGASLATFTLWPRAERALADHHLRVLERATAALDADARRAAVERAQAAAAPSARLSLIHI